MKKLWLIPAVLLVLAGGCARVNREAELDAIRAADAGWSMTPPNLDRFMSFLAEDATVLLPDIPVTSGRQGIRSLWSPMFGAPGFSLKWRLREAELSPGGKMGYTFGTFELAMKDSAGKEVKRTGKYVTIWEKQADGEWKAVVDSASMDSPSAKEGP